MPLYERNTQICWKYLIIFNSNDWQLIDPNADLPRLMIYALKVLWQSTVLLIWLLSLKRPDYVLVQVLIKLKSIQIMSFMKYYQNPPSIPTLAIVWMVCRLRGSVFVIDWHNYGFTILGLTLGDNHFLVKTCKWFETYFGSKSDFNFCVTNAMKEDLNNRFSIRFDINQKKWFESKVLFNIFRASVLYDRPPDIFAPISIEDKHNLFLKLKEEFNEFAANDSTDENQTVFTICDTISQKIVMKPKRPVLVMSSTSWTEDEDFNILFEALQQYDNCCKSSDKWPQIICAVTGKGPLKEFYRQKIADIKFNSVKVLFPWLTADNYPKLVASADLGVCLHKSSSNLDLPMKVVDMFGCCLPVCAFDYDWSVIYFLLLYQNYLIKCLNAFTVFTNWWEMEKMVYYSKRVNNYLNICWISLRTFPKKIKNWFVFENIWNKTF